MNNTPAQRAAEKICDLLHVPRWGLRSDIAAIIEAEPSEEEAELKRGNESGVLTLPYPPALNNLYMTIGRRRVLSTAGRDYKVVAARIAFQFGLRPLCGEIIVSLDVYRPRRIGDLDNTFKVVLDSLKGIAWIDDKQVVEIHARRHDDKLNPRVEIEIKGI